MFEEILEKLKEYKIFVGLSLIGVVLAGLFLLKGNAQPQNQVSALAQEVVTSASSETNAEKRSANQEKISEKNIDSEESEKEVTVDVKGAVKNPGVYQLRAGARVHDALQKAGGLLPDAESKSINQAQKLTDEAVVYVARVGEEGADVTQDSQTPAGNGETAKGKSGLVNLNTATEAELQTVSGIGQKKAQDIIAYREANGKFKSVDELKNVSGIGAKTLEKLKDYVTVDK
ncbi:DNA uptake protein [Streptococcus cristatus]|uniref:Competence protein CelA n=2 Tax=Streptococcus cristatus TaxID=45634 RepID=A0A512AB75_STRCR|nr:helix-hairpin-helix domain-containing protein [Streptococcus cristatus]AGK71446.1 DNA uptake protein [Streptococcus cristatus AS 1.3089]GEN96966.1 competence protein CelA [Streptococcus cristatus]SQI48040.1 DNA uptake protein [Streptococcus cristatus]